MMDPVSIATSAMLKSGTELAVEVSKEPCKGFLNYVSYEYLGGKKLEISKAKTEVIKKIEQEKLQIAWDKHGKAIFEQNLVETIEKGQKGVEYQNLFKVIGKVVTKILPTQDVVEKNNDNLKILLDEAKNISDDEMQSYIANILAEEYNKPNTVSRQTIQIIRSCTKLEIQLFEKYASLLWSGLIPAYYFNIANVNIFVSHGFNHAEFQFLQSLGLINSEKITMTINLPAGKLEEFLKFTNCNLTYLFKYTTTMNMPECYSLSRAGNELLKFINLTPNSAYIKWCKDFFDSHKLRCDHIKDV